MKRLIPVAAAFWALSLPSLASAQVTPSPRMEVTLTPSGEVTVGTPLHVALTLLSPGYLVKSPDWPDLQIADAITRHPPTVTRTGSRTIDGNTWATITRLYEITPQRATTFAFEPQTISLTYADPRDNQPVDVQTGLPAISFSASIPDAARDLAPFVAASALTLTQTVEGPGADSRPGVSVTRTLRIEAKGTQAMLLPPLLGGDAPSGLHAYPREAELSDVPGERGAPGTATRVETIVYVAQAAGAYSLPSTNLAWWNTSENRVDTASADNVAFDIGAPPGALDSSSGGALFPAWPIAIGAMLALAAGFALRHRVRRVFRRFETAEPALFHRLVWQAKQGRLMEVRKTLALWLKIWNRRAPPAAVNAALYAAEREVWGTGKTQPIPSRANRQSLVHAIRACRKSFRANSTVNQTGALPPLNPW